MGTELVHKLDGSELAKQRLKAILQTLSGELSVPEACEFLQLSEARFHELRSEWLQSACGALEPKAAGRPAPPPPNEKDVKIQRLEEQIKDLRIDLRAAQVREELALVMPHVLQPKDSGQDRRKRLDEMQKEWEERGIEKKTPPPSDRSSNAKNSTPSGSAKSGKSST